MSTPRAFLTTACFVPAEVKRLIALAGKDQVAVLEFRKDIVRTTLPIVETRSGKKVTFQDDEARKSGK
jgi:hypothetical protein